MVLNSDGVYESCSCFIGTGAERLESCVKALVKNNQVIPSPGRFLKVTYVVQA